MNLIKKDPGQVRKPANNFLSMDVIAGKPVTLHIVHGGVRTEDGIQDSIDKIQRDLALLVAEEKDASAKGRLTPLLLALPHLRVLQLPIHKS